MWHGRPSCPMENFQEANQLVNLFGRAVWQHSKQLGQIRRNLAQRNRPPSIRICGPRHSIDDAVLALALYKILNKINITKYIWRLDSVREFFRIFRKEKKLRQHDTKKMLNISITRYSYSLLLLLFYSNWSAVVLLCLSYYLLLIN